MKSNVNWKPMGHSAKRWQGMTRRKDSTATLRETRAPQKKVGLKCKCGGSPGALTPKVAVPPIAQRRRSKHLAVTHPKRVGAGKALLAGDLAGGNCAG